MDDEYLKEYIEKENEEKELEQQSEPVPEQEETPSEREEPKKKKKRRFGFSNVLIILYLLAHIAYTVWMFTDNWVHALLWLFISLVELAIFSVIMKTQKKVYLLGRLLSLIFLVVLLFNTSFSAFMLFTSEDRATDGADYALVLGYGLEDDKMTEILQLRCDKAIEYLQSNPQCKAVLCGGITRGSTITEALAMKQYMMRAGIPENRLILEDASTGTETNIANAKQIIGSSSKIVVISSNFHIHRIRQICRKAGLAVKGVRANTPYLKLPDALMWEKIKLIGQLMSN